MLFKKIIPSIALIATLGGTYYAYKSDKKREVEVIVKDSESNITFKFPSIKQYKEYLKNHKTDENKLRDENLKDLDNSYLKVQKRISSSIKLIKEVTEKHTLNISQKTIQLAEEGSIEDIIRVLDVIASEITSKSLQAVTNNAELSESLAKTQKAREQYKIAVGLAKSNKEFIDTIEKGKKFSKKIKNEEDEKYFENKLYFGKIKDSNGIYQGVLKNGKKSYAGIFKRNDGSFYIGEYNDDHCFGYGFLFKKGFSNLKSVYLLQYDNNGNEISSNKVDYRNRGNKGIYIGQLKRKILIGKGLIKISKDKFLLAQFNNKGTPTGISYYFDLKNNKLTWRNTKTNGSLDISSIKNNLKYKYEKPTNRNPNIPRNKR